MLLIVIATGNYVMCVCVLVCIYRSFTIEHLVNMSQTNGVDLYLFLFSASDVDVDVVITTV